MKKKLCIALSALMIMSLSAGLTGCGGSNKSGETEPTTASASATTEATTAAPKADTSAIEGSWDNDDEEMSLTIFDDGTAIASDTSDYYEFTYEWDGTTLTLDDGSGTPVKGTLDDNGELSLEDIGGTFYIVDEAYYVPDEDEEDSDTSDDSTDSLDLEDTSWTVEDEVYRFYGDGTAQIIFDDGDVADATYEWDGQSGTITMTYDGETASTDLLMVNGSLAIVGEDGDTYIFEPEDSDSSEDSSDEDSGDTYIFGDYENSEADFSLTFYDDGTVDIIQDNMTMECTYTISIDGELEIDANGDTLTGTYYSSDDSVGIDGIDGYFEYVG